MKLNMLLYTFYLLDKKSTKEKIIEEFEDVFEMFADFFRMIKELTYDKIAAQFGTGATGIIFVMIMAIVLIFILMKIINH